MCISREGQGKWGGGNVGGVGADKCVWGVAEGFGALVRLEGGWGEEVGGLVLREEMVSVSEAIFVEVADLC